MVSKIKGLAASIAVSSAMAVSAVQAAPILNVSGEGQAAATAAEAAFKSFLLPGSEITEGFETYSVGRYSSLTTSVGTFTQNVAGNGGGCSGTCADGVAVLDASSSPFSGRFPTPTGADNKRWLDDFDSAVTTLSVISGYKAIGFYITDPNDVDGDLDLTLTIGGVSVDLKGILGSDLDNGDVYYISIFDENGLGDIVFTANSMNDGFGIDNVTIGKVPEPATVALLGLGMLGLGLARRRKS